MLRVLVVVMFEGSREPVLLSEVIVAAEAVWAVLATTVQAQKVLATSEMLGQRPQSRLSSRWAPRVQCPS